jgi:hypothetical protein
MPTKSEWNNHILGNGTVAQRYDLGLLKSAAVQQEKLTGSPEWDQFLTKVQARRDEFWKQYESWRERLEFAKTDDMVKECQINVALYKNCALALDEIMDLPGQILKERSATHA